MSRKLFVFNPTCDLSVACQNAEYNPNPLLIQFENELSFIMSFLAQEGDAVVVHDKPNKSYLDFIEKNLGFLPSYVLYSNELKANYTTVPWGWSPVIFKKYLSIHWNGALTQYFSRHTGYALLDNCEWDSDQFVQPQYFKAENLDEVKVLFNQFGSVVVKSPWSSSGRGVVFMNELSDKMALQWIDGFIKGQGCVYVEPQYEKVLDFSLLFHRVDNKIEFVGETFFFTSDKKQYQGHYVGNIDRIKEFQIQYSILTEEVIRHISAIYKNAFEKMLLSEYGDWFGVDCMIVKHESEIRIVPFCELNMRCTMGFVAHSLSKVFPHIQLGKMIIDKMSESFKLKIVENSTEIIPLIPISPSNKFAAWIEIIES